MKSKVIDHLLSKFDIHPVLVDIGASGSRPEIWSLIAKHSTYVGFDPDLRDLHEEPDKRYYRSIIVNEAVTSEKGTKEILFYFTKSPYCSSTLKPDSESLSRYLFCDLFKVEKEEKVRASSLNSIMTRLSLSCIDWFKTDSQGTDLRILNSLRDEVRSRVLAVDIEPGLIDSYVGEDLFVDAHRDLTQNGFWLSNLDVHGAVRMKRSTLSNAMAFSRDITGELIEKNLRKSPGWVNARYFRTTAWLAQCDFSKRDYVLLWVFCLLDNQIGFAFDLTIAYERVFGEDDVSQLMRDECIVQIRQSQHRIRTRVKSLLPVRIKRWLQKLIYYYF